MTAPNTARPACVAGRSARRSSPSAARIRSRLRDRYAADLAAVRDAAARIDGRAKRTPVATCTTLDQLAGRSLFFKCEQYQKGGSFKFRGACNAVMKLSDADAARGVATHSSGNFAQAVALAARARGIAAHVVMPRTRRP